MIDNGKRVFLAVDDAFFQSHRKFFKVNGLNLGTERFHRLLKLDFGGGADFQALDVVGSKHRTLVVGQVAETPFPVGEVHEVQLIKPRCNPFGERSVENAPGVFDVFKHERKHDDGEGLVAFFAVLVEHRLGRQAEVDRAVHLLFENFVAVAELVGGIDFDFDFALGAFFNALGHHQSGLIRRMGYRGIVGKFKFHGHGLDTQKTHKEYTCQ